MLAQLFEHLFQSIDSTLVTNIFIWLLSLYFVLLGGVIIKIFISNSESMLQH